jgi:hypothetical protein
MMMMMMMMWDLMQCTASNPTSSWSDVAGKWMAYIILTFLNNIS